jgi:putative ABC transport system permease protein
MPAWSRGEDMTRLFLRSLLHYWRTNAAVVAGVATAVAVLAGALLVGQSVRSSLQDLLVERIGATAYVISADRYFSEDLLDGLPVAQRVAEESAAADPSPLGRDPDRGIRQQRESGGVPTSCPIIAIQGVLVREASGRRAFGVNVYGVDERFWQFHSIAPPGDFEDRAAVVGAPLAAHLGVAPGDGMLLRIETDHQIPGESLYGQRESAGRTIRLTCGGVASAARLGEFALRPGQGTVFSVFVPLKRLQRDLSQPSRANAVLVAGAPEPDESPRIRQLLRERASLADVGVRLRPLPPGQGVAVESARILLDDSVSGAAFAAAREAGAPASGVLAYLANVIRAGGREIPYSVVAAADLGRGTLTDVRLLAGAAMSAAATGAAMSPTATGANESIWLNEWAWRDLGVPIGAPVELDYYHWEDSSGLVTRTARFRLAGVVAIGGDVNASLAPDVPGITGAKSVRTWDPPFPLDLRRIRPADETYWDRYRATPKAFVTLAGGQALWQSRFGRLTSVRAALPESTLAPALRSRLDPEAAGYTVVSVRRSGLDASRGAVDLGEYFLYFSFFLIVAAVLLSASFFRLGVEQRAREIGTLRAVGFSGPVLRWIFLAEGALLSVAGSLVGAVGALVYGGTLVAGLRTWWIGAVGTERVHLHVSWAALGVGVGAGVAASLGVIVWTLRGLSRSSPRALLSGMLESRSTTARRARVVGLVAAGALAASVAVLAASAAGVIPDVEGFFGAGTLLLVASLSLAAVILRRARPRPIAGHGWRAVARLAFRGAAHRPARSLLPVALIASAAFIVVSVEAFRKDAADDPSDRRSGTGGYALVGTSALPIVHDPDSAAGREALGITTSEVPESSGARIVAFRQREGDDASCLNLYAPREPRILGAPRAFLAEGRFSFAASEAASAEERRNPWILLDREPDDGAIPAIGDANTVDYSLHLAVGRELTVRGGNGAPVRLRLVAALSDSILQGVLVVSERNFLRAFPEQEGYRFFLLDVPAARAAALVEPLTDRLTDWGVRIESSGERLAAFHQVENTYLSTFQSLGGLGLVLGTIGLAAVLLRNVLERRGEIALLRAVGYRGQTLAAMLVAEHLLLMVCGLACGTVSALVAIAPAVSARGGTVPVAMVGLLLVAVTAAGLVSSVVAGLVALRSPLLAALRSE